jgi:hypothetical protein
VFGGLPRDECFDEMSESVHKRNINIVYVLILCVSRGARDHLAEG